MLQRQKNPGDHERDQDTGVLWFVRLSFVGLMLVVMLLYSFGVTAKDQDLDQDIASQWMIPIAVALVLSGLFLAIDIVTPRKKIATITGVIFGLVAGLIATWVLTNVIDLVVQTWEFKAAAIVSSIKVLLGVSLAFLGITTVLQTQDEFRLVIPYVEFAKQMRGPRPLLVDTSALIDARIVDIGQTGLIQQTVVIPEFVLTELQALADSSDKLKREKGRRGLDMVGRLQRMGTVDVVIDTTPASKQAVDQALVELGASMGAMLVTLDSGLARIASIRNVSVVNIHDLGNALKPTVIPGKSVRVELIKAGEQDGQGVGYLEDGTMVVAEDGGPHIGEVRDVVITSSMQTAAGRLLFARVHPEARDDAATPSQATPSEESSAPDAVETGPMQKESADEALFEDPGKVHEPKRVKLKGSARNPRR